MGRDQEFAVPPRRFGISVGRDQGVGVTPWGFEALYELLGFLLGDEERGWGLELKGGAWGIVVG